MKELKKIDVMDLEDYVAILPHILENEFEDIKYTINPNIDPNGEKFLFKICEEFEEMYYDFMDLAFECVDCGIDTRTHSYDYYAVLPEIWEKHGARSFMLCLNCLEKRVGRELVDSDFLHGKRKGLYEDSYGD